MAGQRTAGYCTSCNRGVTIVRPQSSGLMEKMRSALSPSDDDTNWVCTKCGHPATRGFAPPRPEVSPEPTLAAETQNHEPVATGKMVTETSQPDTAPDNPATPDQPPIEKESAVSVFNEPPLAESSSAEPNRRDASCHLCNNPVPFDKADADQQVNCPACHQPVVLPGAGADSSALTAPPLIIKLDDIPDRPEISKALCTQCNFELTYPKRLMGKDVDCPSCSIHFALP